MIKANDFLTACLRHGFGFFTGTPCSYLKPFINYVIDHDDFRFIDATNEGDGIAIAAGVSIAGKKPVVMFQNSGLGNAVNPLTSLAYPFRIPLLLIVTHRGEPGGAKDEPQHELMGKITASMLETMQIPWRPFPKENDRIEEALDQADDFFRRESRPFAFLMSKNDVEKYALSATIDKARVDFNFKLQHGFDGSLDRGATRGAALRSVQAVAGKGSIVIATTGYTGRELYTLDDRENQFYMVGSMGCALPLGFGLAVSKPKIRVYVIDGDGALLMRQGSMATVGAYRPANLIHILLDNEAHESTGGQSTVSHGISFSAIAWGFGYQHVYATDSLAEFENLLHSVSGQDGPAFIHFKTKKGVLPNLGRPELTPRQVKERLTGYLANY